jgi:mono/diheme cytochrome c family protein
METVISGRSRLLAGIGMGLFALLAITESVAGEETIFLKEGKPLDTQNCSQCHGEVENSAKTGRSMNRIRTSLRTQPQHRPVSTLTDEQVLLIAIALKEGEE